MEDNTMSFDYQLLITYYAYKCLMHHQNRCILYKDFENFISTLKAVLKKESIVLNINRSKYIVPRDVIGQYPNYFCNSVINSNNGFFINANISAFDIRKTFFYNIMPKVEKYLDLAFGMLDKD